MNYFIVEIFVTKMNKFERDPKLSCVKVSRFVQNLAKGRRMNL